MMKTLRWVAMATTCLMYTHVNAQAPDALQPVRWLTGCWLPQGEAPGSVEQWMTPAGGTMLGMKRTIKDGRMDFFEFMELKVMDDGTLAYIAHPMGRSGTVFPLLEATAQSALFENTAVKFPQRIAYRLTPTGAMELVISVAKEDPSRQMAFVMHRVACPTVLDGAKP